MKMVVLMPGPSLMANRLMSKMSAMKSLVNVIRLQNYSIFRKAPNIFVFNLKLRIFSSCDNLILQLFRHIVEIVGVACHSDKQVFVFLGLLLGIE